MQNNLHKIFAEKLEYILRRPASFQELLVEVLSEDDSNSIEETAYLLRSPANAERLRASIKQYEQGKIVKKNLLES